MDCISTYVTHVSKYNKYNNPLGKENLGEKIGIYHSGKMFINVT